MIAAEKAGHDLNRRSFVEAMARVTNYPGTLSPELNFGTDKLYGPVEYRVVRLHNNDPSHTQCIDNYLGQVRPPVGRWYRTGDHWYRTEWGDARSIVPCHSQASVSLAVSFLSIQTAPAKSATTATVLAPG